MSAFELMRWLSPNLTDDEINAALDRARARDAIQKARWDRRQWRRVISRRREEPHRARLHAAYRRRRA